jgi:putative methyltransferase (TIGR04325 family)
MKKLVQSLTLPMLVRMVKHAVNPPRKYGSYEEALADCDQVGYELNDIVRVVAEKTAAFRSQIQQKPILDTWTVRTLIGTGLASSSGGLKVLDFGGGAGHHYFIARQVLGQSANVTWGVVETPAMVLAATPLQDVDLRFFNSVEEASAAISPVDLVFTSGALQYCPDPLFYLQRLVEVGARYVYVTRTEVTEAQQPKVSLQTSKLSSNGPGPLPSGFSDRKLTYPITHVSRRSFEQTLQSRYEIRFTVDEDGDTYRVGDQSIRMLGYFCERK